MIGILTYPRGLGLPLTDADIRLKERLGTLKDYIKAMVGAVYTGSGDSARYFDKRGEFIISPKAVKIEGIFTNYATGTAVTVPTVIPAGLSNSYLIGCVVAQLNLGISGYSFGTQTPTLLTGSNSTSALAYMSGLASPLAGSTSWACTMASSGAWRAFVVLLSGVNQSTPYVDLQGGYALTSWSFSMAATNGGILIDMNGGDGTPAPSTGQTAIVINGINSGAYQLSPTLPTHTESWNGGGGHMRFGVFSANPA